MESNVWDEEKMVPMSHAVRMLTTDFEWEAVLFIEVYMEISGIIGKEATKNVLAKARYRTGQMLGKEGI